MAGFELKTRKAASKRFWKATATGQVRRAKAGHGHFLAKRGQKARDTQGATLVNASNYEQVNKLVPALGAKRKRSQAIKNALRRMLAELAATKAAKPAAAKPAKAAKAPAAK